MSIVGFDDRIDRASGQYFGAAKSIEKIAIPCKPAHLVDEVKARKSGSIW